MRLNLPFEQRVGPDAEVSGGAAHGSYGRMQPGGNNGVSPSGGNTEFAVFPHGQAFAVRATLRAGSVKVKVLIDERWEDFVNRVVRDGLYGSAGDVVGEGLRLLQEREVKLAALRATLEASIALGGDVEDERFEQDLAAWGAEARSRGVGA